jgi:hypothetical protein
MQMIPTTFDQGLTPMPTKKNFYNYSGAKAAVQALGIKSLPDYIKRYREDPRLPSRPRELYADAGWIDW